LDHRRWLTVRARELRPDSGRIESGCPVDWRHNKRPTGGFIKYLTAAVSLRGNQQAFMM
jgi:hypothetical protein